MSSSTRGYSPDPGQEFRVLGQRLEPELPCCHTVGGDILCQRWTTMRGWFGRTSQKWRDYAADELEVRCTITGERDDGRGQGQRTWIERASGTHYSPSSAVDGHVTPFSGTFLQVIPEGAGSCQAVA